MSYGLPKRDRFGNPMPRVSAEMEVVPTKDGKLHGEWLNAKTQRRVKREKRRLAVAKQSIRINRTKAKCAKLSRQWKPGKAWARRVTA